MAPSDRPDRHDDLSRMQPARVIHGETLRLPKDRSITIIKKGFDKGAAPYRLGNNKSLEWENLTPQSKILLCGLVQRYCDRKAGGESVVMESVEIDGVRRHPRTSIPLPTEKITKLVELFRGNPRLAFGIMRSNLVAIAEDTTMNSSLKMNRLSRYYDAMVDLTLRLDYAAFNPARSDDKLTRAAPPHYLPNGFLDLGTDNAENGSRRREKILIDKGSMLAKLKPVMIDAIVQATQESKCGDSEGIKQRIAIKIATWLSHEITYDDKQFEPRTHLAEKNIEEGVGVCRHYSANTQVMYQQMGILAHLVKCNYSLEPAISKGNDYAATRPDRHAANAVKLGDDWYLMDITHSNRDAVILHKIDPQFAQRNFPQQLGAIRFSDVRRVHVYDLVHDGYWNMRSLERLEGFPDDQGPKIDLKNE